MKKPMKFLSTRRFQYGSTAIAFTVIFSVVVLLLNAVFSFVGDKNGGLYLDLTQENIYTLSDASLSVLASLDGTDGAEDARHIEIIFAASEDRVADNESLLYVRRLAEKYASASARVTIQYHDCIKDPLFFNAYKKTGSDTVSQTSVIVNCPETKRYVVYPLTRFFKFDENGALFAYDGENRITGAIMQTATANVRKAAFVTGHGEDKRSGMESLLHDQGYEVSEINLKNITDEELSAFDLLVICNPKYDYTGISEGLEGRVNEIGLLNTYLTGSFGNLMVFVGPDTPNLTEFYGFLSDDWGTAYAPGSVMTDDADHALDPYGLYFVGTPVDGDSYAAEIHKAVTSTGAQNTVFGNAAALGILFEENGQKSVSPVYTTSKNAAANVEGKAINAPYTPVMTLSTYRKYVDNKERRANVLLCGSVDFLNFVEDQRYANGDIIRSAFAVMGNTSAVTGIKYKVAEDSAITVTQTEFTRYLLLLAVLVPLIIAGIGTYVYIKRKKA